MAGCSAMLMVEVFTNKFYSLAEKQLVSLGGDDTELLGGGCDNYAMVVGSSHGWIAFFSYKELELFLWNPVTRRRIDLPPGDNLPSPKNEFYLEISKLILSSSNPEDADCRVIVLYGLGSSRLAFCCPSQSGADWISFGTSWSWWYHNPDDSMEHRLYADMAYSSQHNRLLCMTGHRYYELERWDLEDPWSPTIDGKDVDDDGEMIYAYMEGEEGFPYLVIAGEDEVLVVVRKCYDGYTTGFTIFKIVQEECGKITVHPLHSLDAGLAMFVGLNHSFALSATEFPELKPNSIYFTDRIFHYNQGDIGIFDYQSQILYPCYSPQEHYHHDSKHRNAEESDEEDNNGSNEERNGEAEDDGSDEDHNGEDEEDGVYRAHLKLVWFRPSSHPV